MKKAAKLRTVSSVSVRSGFSVRSARGDRNEVEACRPSPAPERTVYYYSRTVRAVERAQGAAAAEGRRARDPLRGSSILNDFIPY